MQKNIFLGAIFIVTIYCFTLLAEGNHITSSSNVLILEQQKEENNSEKGLESNQDTNNVNFLKILTDPFKAFGLHIYIDSNGRFEIADIPVIINDYKEVFANISHLVRNKLKNLSIADPLFMVIGVTIAIWGVLLFVVNQFFIPLLIKHSTKARESTMEVALYRFFVFIEQNYPALITFLIFYFLIDYLNISNAFIKVLFWGFGGWLFISCYKTVIIYILAPHRIRNIYTFHDRTITYIRNTIKHLSISIIIYFVFVNVLNILNISLTGRFFCSLVFITTLFIITIIYIYYGFNKTIYHPYVKRYTVLFNSGKMQTSRLFLIAANGIYFSFSLLFCVALVLILTGYLQLAIHISIWFGIISGCLSPILPIKYLYQQGLLKKMAAKVITSGRAIITQIIATVTFLNPLKIVFLLNLLFRSFVLFILALYRQRFLIMEMAKRDISTRYIGSFLGFFWAFINPLMTILVFWFVFSIGFRVRPVGDVPFIVVFAAGFIPWMAFNETLMANANVITGNQHLVKKMVFPIEILPVVNLSAGLITHCVMVVILAAVLLANGLFLSVYNIQFIYYLFAMAVFCLGLSWLLAPINVFYRDVGMILGVVINMWFWLTPIVWEIHMLPSKYHALIKLNPMFYIVEGYRNSFIYHIPFWHNYKTGVYFWAISLFMVAVGGIVFKKLKHELAEIL